jgi:hypothetical protein
MNSYDNKIMWPGRVSDNNDPLMLNRVRVYFDTENNQTILDGIPDTYNNKSTKTDDGKDLKPEFKWTKIDPFCFLPLIPLFIKITPKINESVNLFYPNPDYGGTEQYYILGTFSSPLTSYRDNYKAQRLFATKGNIVDAKLLKNPTNNEYYKPKTKGVFPEPEDTALMGRGTCDIIIRDSDVLLRAGKSTTTPNSSNKQIDYKETRAFTQLSDFSQRINDLGTKESNNLLQDVAFVKNLIEWNILNPDNNASSSGKWQDNIFSVTISLYRLPEKREYTTKELKEETPIPQSDKSLVTYVTLNGQKGSDVVILINKFIKQCNDGQLNIPGYPIVNISNQFPLVFRASPEIYKYLTITNGSVIQHKNISGINSKINFKTIKNGFGLIFFKDKTGPQVTIKKIEEQEYSYDNKSTTYNVSGGDKLLLLSHESKIPSKEKVMLDGTTMMGISQDYLVKNVLPNTDPMVRGDELIKFMNLVIKFLVSHVHPFPGLPPVPTATDGTQSSVILQQLQNASETILNQNIRIN